MANNGFLIWAYTLHTVAYSGFGKGGAMASAQSASL